MEAPPRVSVVVPVFDPGPYIEPAIRSILGQTLPAGQLEAIFVDDGSTDGTGARLDRLAAEYPTMIRVIHSPPSGAPGRPRNIGIEAARGDYIQFLDADDELGPDALESLVAIADRNGSDVVLGKFASATMRRSQGLFERTVERTTLEKMPALVDGSLGPTKLYRRSFLLSHGIVFPEGWRQMEDQAFNIRAYARARSIAIWADRPSYFFHRRGDDGHLTAERLEPVRHFRNLRTVLDLIDAETIPGALRDRIVRRMLRVEVLNRVSEPDYLELSDEERARLFPAARDFVRDRIDPAVIGKLGAIHRLRCELLRADRPDDLLVLARQLQDLEMTATIDRVDWEAGVLRVSTTARLTFRSTGRPLQYSRSHGPSGRDDSGGGQEAAPFELTRDAGPMLVQLVLRSRPSVLEWYVSATAQPLDDRVGATVRARIDPLHLGAGSLPIDAGSWDLHVRLTGLGIEWSAPLGAAPVAAPAVSAAPADANTACRPALLGDPVRIIVPAADAGGFRLEVDPPTAVIAAALKGRPVRLIRDGDRLCLDLPVVAGPGAGSMHATLVVVAPDGERLLRASLRPRRGRVVFDAVIVGSDRLPAGRYAIRLRLGGNGDADVPLGAATVDEAGRLRVDGLERLSAVAQAGADVAWSVARVLSPIERAWRWTGSMRRRVDRRLERQFKSHSRTMVHRHTHPPTR